MKSDLVVWKYAHVPGGCFLTEMLGFDAINDMVNGTSLASKWPKNVRFTMDPESPTDNVLSDSLDGRRRIIVASQRLTDFLRARNLPHVEYLPVTIINHKKRPVKEAYFFINPTDPPDVLDEARSGAKRSTISKNIISDVKRLVIDVARLDPARQLFRVKNYRKAILVRRALADAITAEGFTGVGWTELQDYTDG